MFLRSSCDTVPVVGLKNHPARGIVGGVQNPKRLSIKHWYLNNLKYMGIPSIPSS
jgi:hypothetical protein